MWCAGDNYMCHMCAKKKKLLNSNSNEAVIDKISKFQGIAQISHIHKNRILLS